MRLPRRTSQNCYRKSFAHDFTPHSSCRSSASLQLHKMWLNGGSFESLKFAERVPVLRLPCFHEFHECVPPCQWQRS